MNKIYKTDEYKINEDGDIYAEVVHIFSYETEDEAEDFSILSHEEQLKICGFKEEKTPTKGTVHRYVIDASDAFVVIRENIYTW